MRISPRLKRRLNPLARLAESLGVRLYVVGGCVRDDLLGVETLDLDFVVEGDPGKLAKEAVRRWGGSKEVFDRFGTVRLSLPGGDRIDLARAREETYPAPGALPVVRAARLTDDLKRRDFTVNAMARPLTSQGAGNLIDPFGGAADLKAKLVRILHPRSFRDDPTRLFRAARYAGRFGLRLEPVTALRLKGAVKAGLWARLSRERVRQELLRLLEERDPGPGMRRAREWGLWPAFHPRFRWPAKARKAADPLVRLGICALAMGAEDGEELLRSLPLERSASKTLLAALRIARLRASPRGKPDDLSMGILRIHFNRLSPVAFQPLLLTGEDLKRMGLAPGKEYAVLLDRAAKAQWRGAFLTRAKALSWLRHVRPRRTKNAGL